MLAGSDAVVSAVDGDGALVGFARALSDGAYRSTIFDLIVAPEWRERGLGRALVERILATPALERCRRTDLVCKEEVAPFYESLGFERTASDQLRMEWTRR
jgi:GNAT superfamily N-acetyltransferase